MDWNLFTIGVYGKDEGEFFNQLTGAQVALLVDIRRRRAVRGSRYAFANSKRLQSALARNGIAYRHELELAPTESVRTIQRLSDREARRAKRERRVLDSAFVEAYRHQLKAVDLEAFVQSCRAYRRVALLCVEAEAAACHRSVLASELAQMSSVRTTHL